MAQVHAFGEELGAIFAKTELPGMMRAYLLTQGHPAISLDVFATCVSGADIIQATLLDPAGFGAPPGDQKLSVRGRAAASGALARKRFDEVHTTERPMPHKLSQRSLAKSAYR